VGWGIGCSTARSRPLTVDCVQNVINLHIPRRCLQIDAEAWLFLILFNTDFYRTLPAIITVSSFGFVGTGFRFWRKDRLVWPRLCMVFFLVLRAVWPRDRGSISGVREYVLSMTSWLALGPTQLLVIWLLLALSGGEGEECYWPLSFIQCRGYEFEDMYLYAPKIFVEWYLLKHKDNFKILLCAVLQLLMLSCGPCI
jgi:hypothetical protein